MKYAVICYAIHNKDIASCDWFDDYESAEQFLHDDAQNTYDEEVDNGSNDDVEMFINKGFASVSSCDYEYEWTWHIIRQ